MIVWVCSSVGRLAACVFVLFGCLRVWAFVCLFASHVRTHVVRFVCLFVRCMSARLSLLLFVVCRFACA